MTQPINPDIVQIDDTLMGKIKPKLTGNHPILLYGNPKVFDHLYRIEIGDSTTAMVIEQRYHAGDKDSLQRAIENILSSNIDPITICATDMDTDTIMYQGHNLQKSLDPIKNYTRTFELNDMREFWNSLRPKENDAQDPQSIEFKI